MSGNKTLVRDQLNATLDKLGLVKPDRCDKCDKVGSSRNIWAYVVDRPEDVLWLCIGCYRAANPPKAHKRGDIQRTAKVPPYEQMKADYMAGLSYSEMAAKYGMKSKTNVYSRFKQRAQRRGEWPINREVPAFAIWQTVREAIADQARPDDVHVSMIAADLWAPHTRVRRHGAGLIKSRDIFPAVETPAYHREDCPFTSQGKAGCIRGDRSLMFVLPREEAEDWGYRACSLCCNGTLKAFAALHGFSEAQLTRIAQGRRKVIDYALAVRLLDAVGEPIPEFLKVGRDRRPAQVPSAA